MLFSLDPSSPSNLAQADARLYAHVFVPRRPLLQLVRQRFHKQSYWLKRGSLGVFFRFELALTVSGTFVNRIPVY